MQSPPYAGGGAAMAPAMSSSGCGCKQTMTEISPQAVKQALNGHGEYKPAQRVPRPPRNPNPPGNPPIAPPPMPAPPPGGGLHPCGLVQELCVGDYSESEEPQQYCAKAIIPCYLRHPRNPNRGRYYLNERWRTFYKCEGPNGSVTWVSCDPWDVIDCCDGPPQNEPACAPGGMQQCDPSRNP